MAFPGKRANCLTGQPISPSAARLLLQFYHCCRILNVSTVLLKFL